MNNRLMHARRALAIASAAALGLVGLVAADASGAVAATDAEVLPTSPITVDVLAANGSGCSAGTATVRSNADRTGFTVSYSDFLAEAGPNSSPTDIRKNCQLSLLVTVPQGFTWAVAKARYTGYLKLTAGATALHRTNYYLQGQAANSYSDHAFSGPTYARWSTTDVDSGPVYAPCSTQQVININTELRVKTGADNGTSYIAMTRSSGSVNSEYQFSWQKC